MIRDTDLVTAPTVQPTPSWTEILVKSLTKCHPTQKLTIKISGSGIFRSDIGPWPHLAPKISSGHRHKIWKHGLALFCVSTIVNIVGERCQKVRRHAILSPFLSSPYPALKPLPFPAPKPPHSPAPMPIRPQCPSPLPPPRTSPVPSVPRAQVPPFPLTARGSWETL